MAADASGVSVRPITTVEVLKHLNDFGLHKALATGKIIALSGGQRCRLVLAAAMWNRPHVICFDEPTNYLDREALAMLEESIKTFRGAIVVVSHNEPFVRRLCDEKWTVGNGFVHVEHLEETAAARLARATLDGDDAEGNGVDGAAGAEDDDDDENLVDVSAVEE